MSSFIGDIICKLDQKGRLSFPSIFKKQISDGKFVLKKDIFENCLVLYPYEYWEEMVNIIRSKLNPYNRKHNQFLREFFKDTAEVSLDNNNRLLIPKRLLEQVGIKNEAYLIGMDRKIEIWNKQNFENQQIEKEQYLDLVQKIFDDDK